MHNSLLTLIALGWPLAEYFRYDPASHFILGIVVWIYIMFLIFVATSLYIFSNSLSINYILGEVTNLPDGFLASFIYEYTSYNNEFNRTKLLTRLFIWMFVFIGISSFLYTQNDHMTEMGTTLAGLIILYTALSRLINVLGDTIHLIRIHDQHRDE